jgi:ATP-binding cassette, subfamily B, bacterial
VTAPTKSYAGLPRHALSRACCGGARRRIGIVVVVQLLVGILTIVELQLVRKTVQRLQATEGLTSGSSTLLGTLIVLHLVAAFISALTLELRTPIAELIHRAVSLDVANTAARVSLAQLEDPQFQNQLQRVVNHGQERIWGAVFGGLSFLNLAITTFAMCIALALLAPVVLPATLLSAIPLWVAFHKNTRATHELSHQLTESDRRRQYLERTLAGVAAAKEVRLFNLGPLFSGKIASEFDFRDIGVTAIMKSRIRRTAASNLATALCIGIGLGLVLVVSRGKPLDTGIVAATALGLYQLLGRLRSLTAITESLQAGRLFLRDYAEFLSLTKHAVAGDPVENTFAAPTGALVVDDVSFAYPNTTNTALDRVSLRVDQGSLIAVVGDNGSGKSTLVKIMCGLLEPDSGSVRIGDSVRNDNDEATGLNDQLPKLLSAMFQDYVRYELSLRENVTLSDWNRSNENLRPHTKTESDVLREAGLTEATRSLRYGASTVLSRSYSDGSELSLGQWQRVALARALFRDTPFLILDEPTASLDAVAEEALVQELDTLRRTRGILLITHRLSTARRADEIIVMEYGTIVERGNHDELMTLDGRYALRFRLQAEPYEVSTR